MDKYRKGKNVEEEVKLERLPAAIQGSGDALWLRVRGGTRVHAVLELALRRLRDGGQVVVSGGGAAVRKATSCVELCKQRCNFRLHQITRVDWLRCEEHWLPLVDGLDELVVRRRVPQLHVLLSCTPLDPNTPGYQPPGDQEPFHQDIT